MCFGQWPRGKAGYRHRREANGRTWRHRSTMPSKRPPLTPSAKPRRHNGDHGNGIPPAPAGRECAGAGLHGRAGDGHGRPRPGRHGEVAGPGRRVSPCRSACTCLPAGLPGRNGWRWCCLLVSVAATAAFMEYTWRQQQQATQQRQQVETASSWAVQQLQREVDELNRDIAMRLSLSERDTGSRYQTRGENRLDDELPALKQATGHQGGEPAAADRCAPRSPRRNGRRCTDRGALLVSVVGVPRARPVAGWLRDHGAGDTASATRCNRWR